MITPHTKEEEELKKQGYKCIVGIDEVGRGPLAGPVIAAAVVMPIDGELLKVRDSKKMTPKARDKAYDEILNVCHGYGVGIVEHDVVDEINIYEATKLAMKRAVEDCEGSVPSRVDHLLIDAMRLNMGISEKAIIKGDQICYSISAASVVAKVTRDRLMAEMHEKYPEYGFDKHKGYGTKVHMEALEKHGPCDIHRKSFNPISGML